MDEELLEYYQDREAITQKYAEAQAEEQEQLDNAEENYDPATISWENLSTGNGRCKTISGFSCKEFLNLFEVCKDAIHENIGRGWRSRFAKQDKLLMVLCYIKHYETVDKMKETFNLSKLQLHCILDEVIEVIAPILYQEYVEKIEVHLDQEDAPTAFPEAGFVMDVKFQQIWTPRAEYYVVNILVDATKKPLSKLQAGERAIIREMAEAHFSNIVVAKKIQPTERKPSQKGGKKRR